MPETTEQPQTLRVAFIHPDLGIGGAERLVVDAAVGLQSHGHRVVVYTSHHDPSHCFEETRDGTLEVRVRGDKLIPRSILGKVSILCAILRSMQCAQALLKEEGENVDVIVCDQLSACIPILRQSPAKIFFYCHYPDKLLTGRKGFLKSLYRLPFDWVEEYTTGCADRVVVNSEFTAGIFAEAFPRLTSMPLSVLYPGIRLEAYDRPLDREDARVRPLISTRRTLLSINRFERKKNIALAIHAYAKIFASGDKDTFSTKSSHRLVIAGGYDTRVSENVEYHQELISLAKTYGLSTSTLFPMSERDIPKEGAKVLETDVLFVPSFSDAQRTYLLGTSDLLLYTPSGEHFGIVPVEAMYARLPVLAVSDGGPTESVVDGVTGWLRPPTTEAWASVLDYYLTLDPSTIQDMGERGRERVQERFSLGSFVVRLDGLLQEMGMVNSVVVRVGGRGVG
ncbi:MAG: alpha-1,3/1,6-mannosyltransferase ALG2 [Piptocephalis tieghemiana]|nr:MAG: alpha-1,3/1,6-mannosyltransferase ALG2 [Piptocephalis tieghemiana]